MVSLSFLSMREYRHAVVIFSIGGMSLGLLFVIECLLSVVIMLLFAIIGLC